MSNYNQGVVPSGYISTYLLNGANFEMNVNGSSTPVDFAYTVATGKRAYIQRALIEMNDGASDWQSGNFGAIAGALTNGVDIIVVEGAVENVIANWKTNSQIRGTMYDFTLQFAASGSYIGRWTFASDLGSPIRLDEGDKFIVRVRDNITAFDLFRFKIRGKLINT